MAFHPGHDHPGPRRGPRPPASRWPPRTRSPPRLGGVSRGGTKRLVLLAAGAGAAWYVQQKLSEDGSEQPPGPPQQAQSPARVAAGTRPSTPAAQPDPRSRRRDHGVPTPEVEPMFAPSASTQTRSRLRRPSRTPTRRAGGRAAGGRPPGGRGAGERPGHRAERRAGPGAGGSPSWPEPRRPWSISGGPSPPRHPGGRRPARRPPRRGPGRADRGRHAGRRRRFAGSRPGLELARHRPICLPTALVLDQPSLRRASVGERGTTWGRKALGANRRCKAVVAHFPARARQLTP